MRPTHRERSGAVTSTRTCLPPVMSARPAGIVCRFPARRRLMKIPEILLVETFQRPGALASVLSVIADERLLIEHLQSLRREQGRTLWEITVEIDEQANPHFYSRIDALADA